MADRIADQIGNSGSIYSSQTQKETVMDPAKNDTYNTYWNTAIDSKKITEMTIAEFFDNLMTALENIVKDSYELWIKGSRNWRDYWEVISSYDRLVYLGVFLIIVSFFLYLFFS